MTQPLVVSVHPSVPYSQ